MTDECISDKKTKSGKIKVPVKEIFHKNVQTSSNFLKDVWKPLDNIPNNLSSDKAKHRVNTDAYAKHSGKFYVQNVLSKKNAEQTKNCIQVQEVFENGWEPDENDIRYLCDIKFCHCNDREGNRVFNDFEVMKSFKSDELPIPRILAILNPPETEEDSSPFPPFKNHGIDSGNSSFLSSTTGKMIATLVPLIFGTRDRILTRQIRDKDDNHTQELDTESPKEEKTPPKPLRENKRKLKSPGNLKFSLFANKNEQRSTANTMLKDSDEKNSDSYDQTSNKNPIENSESNSAQINTTKQKFKFSFSLSSGSESSKTLPDRSNFSSLSSNIGHTATDTNFKDDTTKTSAVNCKDNSESLKVDFSIRHFYDKDQAEKKDKTKSVILESSEDNTFLHDDFADFEETCSLIEKEEPSITDFPEEKFMEKQSSHLSRKDIDLLWENTDDESEDDDEFEDFYSEDLYPPESHCHHHQECKCNQFKKNQHMLYRLVKSAGLEIHDVVPDGNCMFRAIVDQLRMQGDITATCNQIRQGAVNWLRENPLQEDGTHLEDFFVAGEESWEQYLNYMSKDGEWGDHIILRGLAEVTKREICIISTIGNQHNQTTIKPNRFDGEPKKIYLGHVNDQHYYSLRPKGWQNWYKEAKKIQPRHQDCQKQADMTDAAMTYPCIPSVLFNCNTQHVDDYSGIPIFHLNFIIQNVLQREDIKTPFQMYSHEQGFRENFDMVGSVEEKLAVNLHAFTLTADHSVTNKDFNAPKVSKMPNFYKYLDDYVVVYKSEPSEHRSHVVVINSKKTHPGYTNLELPNGPFKHCKKVDNTYFLTSSVFSTPPDDSRMSHKERHCKTILRFQKANSITFYHKCPRWPNETKDWISRNRPSGWPSMSLIQKILEVPCVLTCGHHPNSKDPEIEWKFDFSFPEKFLLKKNISEEQRYCFHVFKLLVDFHTGNLKELSTFILKTLFLYTLEVIPYHHWDSCASACILYMISILRECLKNGDVPHYFIPDNNIIAHISRKKLNILVEKVNAIREFPIMSVIIMAENQGVMTTYITDQIIEDLIRISKGGDIYDSVLHTFIPACIKMTATSLSLQKFRQAVTAVTTGYKMLQGLSHEGYYNPYESMTLFSFIKEATQGMFMYQAWWLCFFVDLYRGENLLSSFKSVGHFKKIGEMLVDCPPGDLDHIHVPNFMYSDDPHESFFDEKDCVTFFITLNTFLMKEHELQLQAHYLRGIIKTLWSKLDNPNATTAQILRKYDYLFEFLYSLHMCYVQQEQTEYFQEYMEKFESVCDILATTSSYHILAYVWETLGNKRKMKEALHKRDSLTNYDRR